VSYFGIGIVHGKTKTNVGTLWRTAYQLGAGFIFTIGRRYRRQCSDTLKAWRHVPLFEYDDFEAFECGAPVGAEWIGIETGGQPLNGLWHPKRAVYFLGAEDHGLPPRVAERMHLTVSIPSVRTASFNVAAAGAIVLHHRMMQHGEGATDAR